MIRAAVKPDAVIEEVDLRYVDYRRFSANGDWIGGSIQEVFANRPDAARLTNIVNNTRPTWYGIENFVTADITIGGLKTGDFVVLRIGRRSSHRCGKGGVFHRDRFVFVRGKQQPWMNGGLIWSQWANNSEVRESALDFLAKRVGRSLLTRRFDDETEAFEHWLLIAKNQLFENELNKLVCATHCRGMGPGTIGSMPVRIASHSPHFDPPIPEPHFMRAPDNLCKVPLPLE